MSKIVVKAEDIKAIRKRHSLTQAKLAEAIYDCSTRKIGSWEIGARNCPAIYLWAIVLTFDKIDLYDYGIDKWRKDFNRREQ